MRALMDKNAFATVSLLLLGALLSAPGWAQAEASAATPAQIGEELIVKAGCAGCHRTEATAFTGLYRRGPDLRRVASKVEAGWAQRWILAPRELRATTWMPHFFDGGADQGLVGDIVSYLWERSETVSYPAPPAGDAARGEELFNSIGCTGCHLRDAAGGRDRDPEPFRLQGPNLIRLGSKVEAPWLFAWLRDPKRYAPQTLMPNLRLSEAEAADLTAFLLSSREPSFEGQEHVAGDPERGRQAIDEHGCFGCHLIPGFEDAAPPAGPLVAASFAGHDDSGPDYALSDREREAVAARLADTAGSGALAEGRRLINQLNCRGCHLIEGRGHAIRATVDDVGLLPPNLKSEGSRVQPEWLSAFLEDPETVRLRPWLKVQMPTFALDDAELDTAVGYFAALEAEDFANRPAEAVTARSVAVGRELFQLLECARCHPAGEAAAEALGLSASNLAPSLEIASRRLRYEWIPQWMLDPQGWQPGTKMPSFFFPSETGGYDSPFSGGLDDDFFAEPRGRLMEHFDSGDELNAFVKDAAAVTQAIRDYIWSLGE